MHRAESAESELSMKEKIEAMIEENYKQLQQCLVDFVDETEEDMHILYNMQQLRKVRNDLFNLLDQLSE